MCAVAWTVRLCACDVSVQRSSAHEETSSSLSPNPEGIGIGPAHAARQTVGYTELDPCL